MNANVDERRWKQIKMYYATNEMNSERSEKFITNILISSYEMVPRCVKQE